MLLTSVTIAAWWIKPAIGYLIDNVFNKRIWIFISLFFDLILVLILGLMHMPLFILIVFLILNSTNAAFRDVAVDGIMCVEGKKNNTTGKIQSIQWASFSVAGILTGIAGGYLAEKWGYKAGFLCLIPFYLIVSITGYFYREDPRGVTAAGERRSFGKDFKKILADKRLLVVGLFIFLYRYSPSFGTPLFFVQRDAFHWSKIWIGVLATIGTCFEILGAIVYYRVSQKINMKKWLFISVFIGASTTLCYLYYTPVTAVIYNAIFSFVGMFIFIMVLDFMARNTLKGLEATSFALLCSVSNLALTASNLSGAFLLPVVGLKWLIVASALTSFLCLPLISMIPQAPQVPQVLEP